MKGEATTKAGRKLLTEYNFDGTADEDEQITRDFDLNKLAMTIQLTKNKNR